MRVPGYNSPQQMTFSNRLLAWIIALLCISPAQALTSWDSSSADFAKQIAALTGPGTITLIVTNRSTLTADDVAAIRHGLEGQLRSAGISVRVKNAEADVHITLSQNLNGFLWIAEVQEGSETKVAMLPVAGSAATTANTTAPEITLRATLIYSQAAQILDVTLLSSGADQHMVLLDPQHIGIFSQVSGSWQLDRSYDIAHTQPFPRDLRGRIIAGNEHLFDAYLPGVVCSATKPADTWDLSVSCTDSDDPWPIGSQKALYNSTRNFFTGVLTPGFGPKLPPFYSTAEVTRTTGNVFLFNDLSGAVHIMEATSHKMLIGARDWGSDFAAVRSACGAGMQILTSAAGWPAQDSLRVYEITGREATPASAPMNFDGIITAVWPSSDGASATTVVENELESRYEAYSVSVVCGR